MSFDYFYGQQSDLFTFYRVPKVLFTNERFWNISADAKMLYGILLDRMSLSAKNGWIDKNGRVYIIFTIDEAKMALNCAEQKAIKLLSELEKKAGLIERKRQGLGKPNLIYVKNFISAVDSQLLNCENHNSGTMEITTQELPKSQCNNTDIKNTEFSDTDSIFPSGNGGMMDENDRYQEYFDYFSDQLSMDLLKKDYMSIYGVNTWAMSTYESRKSLIANYIRPLIGDMKLEDVTPRIMDKYYRDLLSVKAVSSKYVKARTEYLTPHTVREVHKTLRNAFNQAVKWELMTRNPVEHATLPKEEHKTRDIWTAEVLQKALEACDDDILRLAINLAFSCSLRMGELLGLTWDCIDISPTSIELGQASIFVEKELQRVNREAMADLDGKDIMFKFPPTFASTHTALVLKTPKTKTSVRKVFLPKTVAEMLVQRKADIEELKDLFGDEFVDFNLVFCSSNGKPIEGQVINRAFNKLIEEKGLPKVVFHSLRHSSITYKLKLNGGDMKSVQGDSGHAQVKMVADVYSHIIDDDRRLNAERMEAAFYSGRQATPEPVQPAATESSADDKELLLKLLQNPEMAALLKSLAKTL